MRDWNVVHRYAVLPWQSVLLSTCYQEPNCSFGGHALTVSLWKPCGLGLTELCSNCYYGCPREDILLTRVSSGSKKSLPLYRKLVNMLPYGHEKDTNNDPLRRTRQTSDCGAASILWAVIRQRCNPTRVARNGADHPTSKGSSRNTPYHGLKYRGFRRAKALFCEIRPSESDTSAGCSLRDTFLRLGERGVGVT